MTQGPSLVAIRPSQQDLFSMQEAAPTQQEGVEQVVCHVDFEKLLAAAVRLEKLQEYSVVDKHHTKNRQTDPNQIIHAVLYLDQERKKESETCAVVLPRDVDHEIDSMMDECISILNKEAEWYIMENQRQNTPTATSGTAPSQNGVAKLDDEWERLVEIVSASFDGTAALDTSIANDDDMVCSPLDANVVPDTSTPHNDMDCSKPPTCNDPLVMFATYWNGDDGPIAETDDAMDTIATPDYGDDVSIVTCSSTESEQDPLDLFPEYWGVPTRQEDETEIPIVEIDL